MFWEGTASATVDGSDVVLDWPAAQVSPTDPRVDGYAIEIDDAEGAPVWEVRGLTTSQVRLDRAILEDVAIVHRVSAHSTREGSGTEFEIVQTAPAGSLAAGTFRPASRGATCTYRNGAGIEAPIAPCTVTDGDFGTFVTRTDEAICALDDEMQCAEASFEEIVIDLGEIRAAPSIVVHATGTPSTERAGIALAASADGIAWTSIASTLVPFQVHAGPVATRYVRLRREVVAGAPPDTAFTQLVNEISVD